MTHIFCTLLNRSTVGIDGIEQYCTMCNLEATASALHSRAPLPIVNGAEGSILRAVILAPGDVKQAHFFLPPRQSPERSGFPLFAQKRLVDE